MNAVHAANAGSSSAATLYDATGPSSHVSGAKGIASPGTDVAHARLIPSGAYTACETNGFCPVASACCHHANDQTKISGSRPEPSIARPGCGSRWIPKKPNERRGVAEQRDRRCHVQEAARTRL